MITTLFPVLLLALGVALYSVSFKELARYAYGRFAHAKGYTFGIISLIAIASFEYYIFKINSPYTNVLAIVGVILSLALGASKMLYADLIDITIGKPLTDQQKPVVYIFTALLFIGGIVALVF